jgi:membrane-bound lytic murein transglycosylase D
MKRTFLAGLAAITATISACAHAPTAREPYPDNSTGLDAPEYLDPLTEAELRAFLAAEEEERFADEQADLVLEKGAEGEGESLALFDQNDFDLPIEVNERVEYWLEYFQERGHERFGVYLSRMGRYEEMIRAELRDRGMPEDLLYLALIESGFSPNATSSAAAVGIWQFIAPTAKRYRLEVSQYVDQRRDPVESTRAALDYLQALYDRFGSWYLAAAGYNTGENRVERILRERADGARGADSLYWEISQYLHSETRNYVPKMIAAAILGKYRDRFGFSDVEVEDAIPFEVVTIPDATELAVIARAAGVQKEVVEALNPHYLRGVTPPGRKVQVRIPSGRTEDFQVAFAKIPPSQRVTKIEHIVQRGENLSLIAKRYRTSVAAIQETNRIKNAHSIRVGQRLVISYGPAGAPAAARTAAASGSARPSSNAGAAGQTAASQSAAVQAKGSGKVVRYRVRAGDSLWSIARQHGVSINELRSWNQLGNSSKIVPGQELKISTVEEVIVYRVQPGDTVWGIAQRHGISADQLMQWNSIAAGATIRPGEELEVPVIR